jgi:hypothetical protein
MAKTAKKFAAKRTAAKKPGAAKPAAETNEEQIAEIQRPRTRSQGNPQPLRTTSASVNAGVSKRSKATRKTKGPTVTEQNALWLQAIIQSLEGVQNDIRTIQENSAGRCPCLLGPNTGAHPQTDGSCTGTQHNSDNAGAKDREDGAQIDAVIQTSPGQKTNTATQTSYRQETLAAARASPRLRSNAATQTSPKQKKSKAVPENVSYLNYPQNVDKRIEKTSCEVFRELYNYWSTHRLLDPREFVYVQALYWTPIEHAIDAINSVTEAITRQDGEEFSLWTRQAFTAWRTAQSQEVPINPEEYQIASRNPQDRLLIPFWIPLADEETPEEDVRQALFEEHEKERFGHTVLLEILPDTYEGKQGTTIRYYDSAQDNLFKRHEKFYAEVVGELLSTGLWGQSTWYEKVECGKQPKESSVCTVHAILNGWSRALRLQPNQSFQGNGEFYREAISMINLALSGYLDSATIYAWLRCKAYVLEGSYADVPRFRSTYPASNDSQFHRKKNSLLGYANFEEYVAVPAGRPKIARTSDTFVELDETHSAQAIPVLMDRLLRADPMILDNQVRTRLRAYMRSGSLNCQLNANFRKAFS